MCYWPPLWVSASSSSSPPHIASAECGCCLCSSPAGLQFGCGWGGQEPQGGFFSCARIKWSLDVLEAGKSVCHEPSVCCGELNSIK